MTNLVKKRQDWRRQRREDLRQQVRQRLKEALHQLAPGEAILLFGSVTRPHAFHERSDVDIAFVEEPKNNSRYGLQVSMANQKQAIMAAKKEPLSPINENKFSISKPVTGFAFLTLNT